MNEPEKQKEKKLEIMMKDYELLKTYSTISSPGIRYNIISLPLATIGILISGTIIAVSSENVSNLMIKIIFLLWTLFMPVLCIDILFIWLGEEFRMIRVGKFCQALEKKVNNEFGEVILNWETFKRKKSESIIYPEFFVVALFLSISLGFSLLGFYIAESIFGNHLCFGNITINIQFSLLLSIFVHLLVSLIIFIFIRKNIIYEKPIEM